MKQLDMRGKACPMPVIETKKLLEELNRAEAVTVLVDNEIAVQNLTKLAGHEGMDVSSDKHSDKEFAVVFTPAEGGAAQAQTVESGEAQEETAVENHIARGRVVVIASDKMGGAWKDSDERIYLCFEPSGRAPGNNPVLQWRS